KRFQPFLVKLVDRRQQANLWWNDLWLRQLSRVRGSQQPRQRRIKLDLILIEIQRHENTDAQPSELLFRSQVHLSRGARTADVEVMKRNRRLNHRLEKQLFLWANFAHPTFFPCIVRRVKLAGVVKIDSGDVLDGVRSNVCIKIR